MRKANIIGVRQMGVVLLAFSTMALCHSCKRAAEKTGEKIIEKSMGDDAKVDIDGEKVVIETDEGKFTTDATIHSWPKELPSDIPEFREGEVISVTTHEMDETKNWVVIFENVPQTALQKYKEVLETNGFKINYTSTAGTGGHLAAEKGKLTVVVIVGEGNATITVGSNQ